MNSNTVGVFASSSPQRMIRCPDEEMQKIGRGRPHHPHDDGDGSIMWADRMTTVIVGGGRKHSATASGMMPSRATLCGSGDTTTATATADNVRVPPYRSTTRHSNFVEYGNFGGRLEPKQFSALFSHNPVSLADLAASGEELLQRLEPGSSSRRRRHDGSMAAPLFWGETVVILTDREDDTDRALMRKEALHLVGPLGSVMDVVVDNDDDHDHHDHRGNGSGNYPTTTVRPRVGLGHARLPRMETAASTVGRHAGSAGTIPAPDNSADVVLFHHVLNWNVSSETTATGTKNAALREAHRILKPGGRLVLSGLVLTNPLPEVIQQSLSAYYFRHRSGGGGGGGVVRRLGGCVAGSSVLQSDVLNAVGDAGFSDITSSTTRELSSRRGRAGGGAERYRARGDIGEDGDDEEDEEESYISRALESSGIAYDDVELESVKHTFVSSTIVAHKPSSAL